MNDDPFNNHGDIVSIPIKKMHDVHQILNHGIPSCIIYDWHYSMQHPIADPDIHLMNIINDAK
jgi:hypothetical protein